MQGQPVGLSVHSTVGVICSRCSHGWLAAALPSELHSPALNGGPGLGNTAQAAWALALPRALPSATIPSFSLNTIEVSEEKVSAHLGECS